MSSLRRRVTLGAFAAFASVARVAVAERARPAIALRTSDPSCPAERELVERVERRLLPASVVDPNERFDVDVKRGAEVMSAELAVTRADGTRATRVLQGASCDDLFDSVAFIAAMTIDPETASQPRIGPPTPPDGHSEPTAGAAVPVPVLAPPTEQHPLVAPRDERAERAAPVAGPSNGVELELGAVAEGTTVIAPYLAPVGRLFFALRWPLRALETSLHVSVARSLENEVAVDGGRGALFTYTAGRAEGCLGPRLENTRLSIEGCAAADVGELEGKGYGVVPPHQETRAWFAPGALGRFAYSPLSRLAFLVEAGFVVPVIRDRFELRGPEALVFRPSPLGLTLGAGVALRLR